MTSTDSYDLLEAHVELASTTPQKIPTTEAVPIYQLVRLQPGVVALSTLAILSAVGLTAGFVYRNESESSATIHASPTPAPIQTPPASFDVLDFVHNWLPRHSQSSLFLSTSPQSRALEWLESDSLINSFSMPRLVQRFALATIFYATEGDISWSPNVTQKWVTDLDECRWQSNPVWEAIACDRQQQYTSLFMNDYGLYGDLPKEIGLLSNLVSLQLAGNYIHKLPNTISALTQLRELNLAASELTGSIPRVLSSLPRLRSALFSYNSMSGKLPGEIFTKLDRLEVADFGVNHLRGTIPTEIRKATSIKHLYLDGNDLSGTLPTELCKLTDLEDIWLYKNSFHGTIPDCLGDLPRLSDIAVHNNSLTGSIPQGLCDRSANYGMFLTIDCSLISCPERCECFCSEDMDDRRLR